jgi:hypothetical protein
MSDPSTAPDAPAPAPETETTTAAPTSNVIDLPKSNGARTAVVKHFSEDEHSGNEEGAVSGPAPEVIDDDEDLLDDYPADVEELDLIHLRIKSIPALRLERFKKVMVRASSSSPPPPPSSAGASPLTPDRNYVSAKTASARSKAFPSSPTR